MEGYKDPGGLSEKSLGRGGIELHDVFPGDRSDICHGHGKGEPCGLQPSLGVGLSGGNEILRNNGLTDLKVRVGKSEAEGIDDMLLCSPQGLEVAVSDIDILGVVDVIRRLMEGGGGRIGFQRIAEGIDEVTSESPKVSTR